jgi:hypothetical protein
MVVIFRQPDMLTENGSAAANADLGETGELSKN